MRRRDHPPLDLVGWRQRDRGDVERAAVDEQTVPGPAADRRQLVEDPRRHLPGGVLGGAAQLGERQRIGDVGPEGQGDGDLEGGAGRQADALWQVGRDLGVETDRRPELGDDGGDVARPRRFDSGGFGDVERQVGDGRLGLAADPDAVAGSRRPVTVTPWAMAIGKQKPPV